jgi:hypothetical protein
MSLNGNLTVPDNGYIIGDWTQSTINIGAYEQIVNINGRPRFTNAISTATFLELRAQALKSLSDNMTNPNDPSQNLYITSYILNLGSSNDLLNNVINIGNPTSTVNIYGDASYVFSNIIQQTLNSPLLELNVGWAEPSNNFYKWGNNAGIQIDSISGPGYIKTNSNGTLYLVKPPQSNTVGIMATTDLMGNMTVNGDLTVNGKLNISGMSDVGTVINNKVDMSFLTNNYYNMTDIDNMGLLNLETASSIFLTITDQTHFTSLTVLGVSDMFGNVTAYSNLNVLGKTSLNGALVVSGNVVAMSGIAAISQFSVLGRSYLNGDVFIGGALRTTGQSILGNGLTVTGSTNLTSNVTISGPTSMAALYTTNIVDSGNLTVSGTSNIGNTTIRGNLAVNNNLSVSGTSALQDIYGANILVTGTSTLQDLVVSGPTVLNDATITNLAVLDTLTYINLNISGHTTLNDASINNLYVTGHSTLYDISANKMILNSSLMVSGSSTFNSNMMIGGNLVVNGSTILRDISGNNMMLSGNSRIGGNMMVSGNSNFNNINVSGQSNLNTIQVTNNATFNSNMIINNSLSIGSNLAVSGSTQIGANLAVGGNLSVTGSTVMNGNLSVSGNTNISGTLRFSGNTTLYGDLTVTGKTTLIGMIEFSGPTTIHGDVTVFGRLNVVDPVSFRSGLNVTGTTNMEYLNLGNIVDVEAEINSKVDNITLSTYLTKPEAEMTYAKISAVSHFMVNGVDISRYRFNIIPGDCGITGDMWANGYIGVMNPTGRVLSTAITLPSAFEVIHTTLSDLAPPSGCFNTYMTYQLGTDRYDIKLYANNTSSITYIYDGYGFSEPSTTGITIETDRESVRALRKYYSHFITRIDNMSTMSVFRLVNMN